MKRNRLVAFLIPVAMMLTSCDFVDWVMGLSSEEPLICVRVSLDFGKTWIDFEVPKSDAENYADYTRWRITISDGQKIDVSSEWFMIIPECPIPPVV